MNLFLLSLLIHITGLTLAAGATFIAYLVNRRFWQVYMVDRSKALTVLETGAPLPRVNGIGMGLLLLSGFSMMYLTNGAFGGQLWLRIKIVLVVVVIINGIIARPLAKKTKALVSGDTSVEMNGQKRKLTLFYLVQLFLFFSIFVLGVFKFR